MEINTVPQLTATAADGTRWSKIPALRFPIDGDGRAVLVQDVTYYSRRALYDAFLAWRRGGPAPTGRFDRQGAFVAKLSTSTPGFDQDGKPIDGVANTFDTRVFADNTWGLVWQASEHAPRGQFPQFYQHVGERRVAAAPAAVPKETGLHAAEFALATPGEPFTSPAQGAWTKPGAATDPLQVRLGDGSLVTYRWYRFVDQPSFGQYGFDEAKKAALQAFVEQIHRAWPIDGQYMAPPTRGELVTLDSALLVTPPKGFEVGYVPIVTRQERLP
jgi:hypothetical protein